MPWEIPEARQADMLIKSKFCKITHKQYIIRDKAMYAQLLENKVSCLDFLH